MKYRYSMKFRTWAIFILIVLGSCKDKEQQKQPMIEIAKTTYYTESYRPQFHFSPEEKWMNDPNGLVYNDGIYHLFYQYYPNDIVWGPMHWGHATSKNMVHWEHKPIALYPDKHGLIFSGSAVLDATNTSGFGTADNPALVAIFTYHLMEGERAGRKDFQTQGIAYSLDNGDTWTKYEGNPVIGNEGIKDFRDPKVFWNEETRLWTMLLVAGDHLQIWSSTDLKEWDKMSEFGKDQGAHGGVWECPDMFKLKIEGTNEEKWVLLISINPGAPNGGSGTQYFIGDFDGKKFTSRQKEPRWLDWGTDNYAGVTYNNTPNGDRIFIGWMSNWGYARDTPTEKWRSAMTVPRSLSLQKIGEHLELLNYPLESFEAILKEGENKEIELEKGIKKVLAFDHFNQSEIKFKTKTKDFKLAFKNTLGESLVLTMDKKQDQFTLDRTRSGKVEFKKSFGDSVQAMPLGNLPDDVFEVHILMDWASVEVFINGGQYVMTSQIFPNQHYTTLEVENSLESPLRFKNFSIRKVERIWP